MNQANRPMKRAHSPDGDGPEFRQYQHNSFHRPINPNFSHQFKKQRHESIPETIETRIARLGEQQGKDQMHFIVGLFSQITSTLSYKEQEDENIKSIVGKICQCVVSFPSRIPTYSTLISLISTKHYNVSSQILDGLHASYPIYLRAQRWQEALTIFQTLSYLVNCKVIQPAALITQFDNLLKSATEEGIPQSRSDYFIYTIMSSLPFCALELSLIPENSANLEQIMTRIENYLEKRDKSHLEDLRVWDTKESTSQMDYLDSLWVQLKNFRSNGWNECSIYRPYIEKEVNDQLTSNLINHNSPTLQIPSHSEDMTYPRPRIVLRLFEDDAVSVISVRDDDMTRTIPGSDKIERFYLETYMKHLIDELHDNSSECGRNLANISDSGIFCLKYVIIETILGELLTLPKPKHDEIVYQSLVRDAGKCFLPSTKREQVKYNFESLVRQAVQVIYENIDTLKVPCLDRLISWLSFHLNDTNFIFPWQTWSDSIGAQPNSMKSVFVRQVLDHCIRFSFHKKVGTMVNEHLPNMIPSEPEVAYKPTFIDEPDASSMAESYQKMITTKQDPPEVCKTLNIRIDGVQLSDDFELKDEKPKEKLMKIDLFFAILLKLGSRSISHLSSGIGKYRSTILALIADIPGGRDQLLKTTGSCLESHPQLLMILVEKMQKAEFVSVDHICDWLFQTICSYSAQSEHKHHLYDILFNTMNRLLAKINRLRREAKGSQSKNPSKQDSLKGQDIEMKIEPGEPTDDDQSASRLIELEKKLCEEEANFVIQSKKIFAGFAELLTFYIKSQSQSNISMETDHLFRMKVGKMQQFYYQYFELLSPHYQEISELLNSVPYPIKLGLSY